MCVSCCPRACTSPVCYQHASGRAPPPAAADTPPVSALAHPRAPQHASTRVETPPQHVSTPAWPVLTRPPWWRIYIGIPTDG